MSQDHRPEDVFRALARRRHARLDPEALWRRIEAGLDDSAAGFAAARRGWVLVGVAAASIVVIVLAGPFGAGDRGPTNGPAVPEGRPSELVLLTPPAAAGGDVGSVALQASWNLDVRLVRGFDGDPPAGLVSDGLAGAGGASPLADLAGQLAALPFGEFGLVGRWRGGLDETLSAVELAGDYELAIDALDEAPGGGVRLRGVRLRGAGRPRVATEIVLQPGRVYLFGVQAPGEDVEAGSLVLALRVGSDTPAAEQG